MKIKRFCFWKTRIPYRSLLLVLLVCDVVAVQVNGFSVGEVDGFLGSGRILRDHLSKRQAAGTLRPGCKYYTIHQENLSWNDAINKCQQADAGEGSTLARIRGGYINGFLTNHISAHNIDKAWFGIHKTGADWTYSNQSCAGYRNWQAGPSAAANCAVLQSDSYWDAVDCSEVKPFICELKVLPLSDACGTNPCANGGLCQSSDTGDGYTCHCSPGYQGLNCQIDIDECAPSPCQNGGACVDDVATYQCLCTDDFSGNNCEICDSEPNETTGQFTVTPVMTTSVAEVSDFISTFSVNGDQYMVTCSHGNDCQVYMFDGTSGLTTPVDTSDLFDGYRLTNGHHVESFDIGGQVFLAVAVNRDPGTGSVLTLSHVFTWSESQSKFVLLQSLPSCGASHFLFFSSKHGEFLALSNTQSDDSFLVDSAVYRWDENSGLFVNFQHIATNRANEAISFEDDETTYLIFAEDEESIKLHRLADDGLSFVVRETPTPFSRVRGFSKFYFKCEWHVVAFDLEASVYVWRDDGFSVTTTIAENSLLITRNGRTCAFEVDRYPFLVTTSSVVYALHQPQIANSLVRYLTFVPGDTRTCHVFEDNGDIYLAVSRVDEVAITIHRWM